MLRPYPVLQADNDLKLIKKSPGEKGDFFIRTVGALRIAQGDNH